MLGQLLTAEVFSYLLIFCRVGSAIMLLPGFGEVYVTARARLLLAVFFSIVLGPVVAPLPPAPSSVGGLATLLMFEIGTGLFLGAIARMLISGAHVAGGIVAYQSSLSSAMTNNITGFVGQDTTVGNLLSMTAVVLLFATDLHHVMLQSLHGSYDVFPAGQPPLLSDVAEHATKTMDSIFHVAMQLAAPHMVVGMLLYLAAGIIARLMPNLQILFLMMPAQLLVAFLLLMVVFGSMMLWYLNYMHDAMQSFAVPL